MFDHGAQQQPQVEVVMKVEGQQPSTSTPPSPPLTATQQEKKELQEQLRRQQEHLAKLERQEAAELEAATDHSRREYLLQQLAKVLSDDCCAQVTKHMAEIIILEHKITSSHFTNWDDRFDRLERRVDSLSSQQSKILDAIQNLTAQLAAAKLITPQLPLIQPKPSPPSTPPSSPPGSVHSSRSPSHSQKASGKAYVAVTAGDQRGPKIPAPNKLRGDDPKTDVGDWAAGTKAYLRGFVCAEQTKVATVLGLLEGPALKWATSISCSLQQSMEDWAFGLGVDKLLQALEDRFADKERARKAADRIARLGQQRYSCTLQALFAEFEQLTSTPGLVMSIDDLLTNFCRAAPEKFVVALYSTGHKDWRSFGRAALDMEAKLHVQAPSDRRKVKKLHLGMKVQQLQQPLLVRIGDSTVLSIREKVKGIPVTFDSVREVRHSLNFYIFPELPFDLVFSMQWLKAVNPRIHWQIPKVELPNSQGVYQPCMIAADHHPKTCCDCLRAREFHALSRQYHHERLFIALVKQTDAPHVSCPPEIQQVVDRYADLMQEPFGLPNPPTKHHIELLPGAVPPKGRIYMMTLAELEELRKQLETLTSKGWIRPSTSEFGAPVLFVPKGNGEFRMCIDYRGLNKITRKSTKPLPRIDDLLDIVQGCIVFSKVDLKSGYHQIEMAQEDVYKTAFKTRYGTYEFLVMPFGLCNSPGTFQTEMHRIFRPYLNKFMVVYLDDILVFSKTTREHAEHLAVVLQSLRDSQYKINREKSSFGVPFVIYLGHVISGDGLAPEAAKIAAIQEWPQPQTMRDVRSFMGLASYYRKFVRNFYEVAAPLTNLTKKDTPFLWSLPCQLAFTPKLVNSYFSYSHARPILDIHNIWQS
ncbi:hypothetical protein CBR_g23577 [Chara braunii]|uniref:Reverse transcriptase domain-containing protein n=1 Tax=Chara braunii TaxID=69332 RepID=A0A388L4K8_CHABU|nr:hypothetical protein CBR_g23577 [Chara braunii]|eukprot:GBG77249.1 hypothetical protein CBR_g23577 [Chara braunii]